MTKWSWLNVKIIITTSLYLTRGPSGLDPRLSGPRGQPVRVWGGSGRALVATCLHAEEKAESVEATPPGWSTMWLGRPASTWRQNELSSLVVVPFSPINTPSRVKLTHHTHFVVLHMWRIWFSSSSAGEALSGVESRVKSLLKLQK
jgi:hypothetical protein